MDRLYGVLTRFILVTVALLVLTTGIWSIAGARAQVTIRPQTPTVLYMQGTDGGWYAFCLDTCASLVTYATLPEFYQRFTSPDAVATYLSSVLAEIRAAQ